MRGIMAVFLYFFEPFFHDDGWANFCCRLYRGVCLVLLERIIFGMDQVIFKYPGQIFVAIATRKADGTLDHQGFALIDAVPKKGTTFIDREVNEVLADDAMLKDLARRGAVDKMEAVVVLGRRN